MTRKGLCSILFALGATTALAAPCSPSPTALCLSGGRFEVQVTWKDFQGRTGAGQATPLTADTGYFWFFSASNIELIVKVLDARALNGKFWVFFGALSNVEYTLTVRDSATGAVKSYQNPSGQFASVGDTSAFAGFGGIASQETVVARGTKAPPSSIADIQRFIDRAVPAAPASTPCPGPSNILFLSNCRFRLDVHWTTSQGQVGSGQAVQLTSDTGYFWFFNDTNVELMVKILDARALNGKFWVFFGALSNVEYTINVVDTVSGALHSYHNPQNTFASVGDTAAFRGGYPISIEADAARAASGKVNAAQGGSLVATAADGTAFTLTIPPGALFEDENITMTPVRATGAFPFAGGLAAGVDLQPSGLVVLPGARLSVHTPAPISRAQETPIAWNGSGEDFFLFPPGRNGGDLELFLQHFGGYGVARGTDAERDLQAPREPVNDDDRLSHRVSSLLRQARAAAGAARSWAPESTTDLIQDLLKEAYNNDYGSLRSEILATDGEPSTVTVLFLRMLGWRAQVEEHLGHVDEVFPGRDVEILSLLERIVKLALHKIHEHCTKDPSEIGVLPGIARLAQLLGLNVKLEIDEAMQCLTFKLTFESTITADAQTERGPVKTKHRAVAEVTLITPGFPALTSGTGTIQVVEATVAIPAQCEYLTQKGTATFKAAIQWGGLFRGGPVSLQALYYETGQPHSNIHYDCTDEKSRFYADIPDFWWGLYFLMHDYVGPDYSFKQEGWTLAGGSDPYATATAGGPQPQLSNSFEETKFTLTHTPR